jgi:hypothetical protein
VTIAKRPSSRAEDARKFARDLPVVTSETIYGTLARRANQVSRLTACQGNDEWLDLLRYAPGGT